MAVLTSMPSVPCDTPLGDYNYLLSVQNKQDYARLHGFELHVGVHVANTSLKAGPWHKVGMLNQVWEEASSPLKGRDMCGRAPLCLCKKKNDPLFVAKRPQLPGPFIGQCVIGLCKA